MKDRSEVEAAKTMELIAGVAVSAKTVGRVLHDVGSEYIHLRDCPPSRLSRRLVPSAPADAPVSVSVSCDGGRMMTRQPGHGPGVHDQAWRETKNADFARLHPQTFETDPHPELPKCFRDPEHVANIAQSAVLEVTAQDLDELELIEQSGDEPDIEPVDMEESAPDIAQEGFPEAAAAQDSGTCESRNETATDSESAKPSDTDKKPEDDYQPKRLYRTCLSSFENAKTFGLHMKREAQRRRFYEADTRAFIADGLPWNWSIWRRHFRDFEPILDFVHVVEYLYAAAKADGGTTGKAWETYLCWALLCWQGNVKEVLAQIAKRLQSRGIDPSSKVDQDSSFAVLHTAYRYLSNNISRMDYARYRRQGNPVTSAPMESLVKQIHLRVKGTEMFWNYNEDGDGMLRTPDLGGK